MDQDDGRHDAHNDNADGDPDDPLSAYENDQAKDRGSLEREAGHTAFGGPTFGHLFDQAPRDDGGFDAEHNP